MRPGRTRADGPDPGTGDRYKWIALANTTAAMFMATLDGSIVIIALPAIFRGIHLDPLAVAAALAGVASLLRGGRYVPPAISARGHAATPADQDHDGHPARSSAAGRASDAN